MSPTQVPSVAVTAVADDAWLLDVREPEEWEAGHAPGAAHVPLGQLVARLGEIPSDQEIVVVCRSGGRSAMATDYLNQVGRRAINLDGGMQAWARAGRPMVSDSGTTPAVV